VLEADEGGDNVSPFLADEGGDFTGD